MQTAPSTDPTTAMETTPLRRVSIVIPVYRGERTLPQLLQEIAPLAAEQKSPAGHRFRVSEVLLVHDCGPDRSDLTIEAPPIDDVIERVFAEEGL